MVDSRTTPRRDSEATPLDFTHQDRRDVKVILRELSDRAVDEMSDSYDAASMYVGWLKLITTAAMVGDGAFAMMDEDADLKAACQRILGSGRFEYDEDAE